MIFLADATLQHLKSVAAWPEFTSERYLVTEEIGRGGMGAVYAAVDTALGRDVAIKVVSAIPAREGPGVSGHQGGRSLSARLTREAQVVAQLEHPGIVPVHDCGVLADGRTYYVMKRVQGRTLRAHLETRPTLADRLRIFERVCEAVAFAHAQGVVHRDLKPENVMVGGYGEVMVMDFGIALSGAADEPGMVLGTRGFMAPEQREAHAGIDHRADVYALGAMLVALLPAEAPPALISISRRATAEQPGDRYPDVAALAADVARFRARQSVSAHREGLAERTVRFARAYHVPILLVLAYIVMRALIAILAGF
ncbi:MAG: serine/threonine protein kinase [Acidobacteriota bacterium]|nr:serine/threonine protein kinase [Acidobacteriota bacterium]